MAINFAVARHAKKQTNIGAVIKHQRKKGRNGGGRGRMGAKREGPDRINQRGQRCGRGGGGGLVGFFLRTRIYPPCLINGEYRRCVRLLKGSHFFTNSALNFSLRILTRWGQSAAYASKYNDHPHTRHPAQPITRERRDNEKKNRKRE